MRRIRTWDDVGAGDLGSIAGTGFLSDAIIHATQRADLLDGVPIPSHSFLVLSRFQVIEALERVVVRPRAVYRQAFEDGHVQIYRPDAPDYVVKGVLAGLRKDYLGRAYGWGQIIAFLPVLLWRRLTGQDAVNLLPLGTICSELVTVYCRRLLDACSRSGLYSQALALAWASALDPNTTDPALLLACEQRDSLPPSFAGAAQGAGHD